jgi:hypothetical protein
VIVSGEHQLWNANLVRVGALDRFAGLSGDAVIAAERHYRRVHARHAAAWAEAFAQLRPAMLSAQEAMDAFTVGYRKEAQR